MLRTYTQLYKSALIRREMAFCQLLVIIASIATSSAQFYCPPATQDDSVRTLELVVPITTTESQVTCQGFDLPSDSDYHVIAASSIINTTASMIPANMLLYACPSPVSGFDGQASCSSGDVQTAGCRHLIGAWATGAGGLCQPSSNGFLIGRRYPYAVLLVVWTVNPTLSATPPPTTTTTSIGSSGMRVYYTANLRPNNSTLLSIQQTNFSVPAQQTSYNVQANCSAACLSQLTSEPIYLTTYLFYMHQLGISGSLTVQRNGNQVAVVANSTYDPNRPAGMNLDSSVQVLPGDSLRLTCTYNSRGVTSSTDGGTIPPLNREVCYAFVAYYPASDAFTDCTQWKTLDSCTSSVFNSQCQLNAFNTLTTLSTTICQLPKCSALCQSVAQSVSYTSCLSGDFGSFLRFYYSSVTRDIDVWFEWCGIKPVSATTTTTAAPPRRGRKHKRRQRRRQRQRKG